ncbi:Predicted N-formylglutamate amidohydrolase [Gemmobacter aquatilis]|uniref:Predicted N-formylglutamate amidohydrolase n=1 Tax=Gemmobacter aquatilis TaxID=933059 RepID=A0A1H8ITG3_9RHOB|nr:N-formylglutamate amidohydrolase [Gemmobacter aquatilis]SEN71854.1 Predicted N-formylglutamate amidohydrolase [Gemmobacter aquatilis]
MTAPEPDQNGLFQPVIEICATGGDVILVCEHACNAFPAPWGDLGLSGAERQAHIAWDPGALGLMRGLARRLGATTVHATVSRLIYDCNRAPDMAGAMPARSETFAVPGNAAISAAERAARTAAIYVPFHAGLHALIVQRIALGRRPVVITIHSFTPVYFGQRRDVEFGVIHDADPALARTILAEAEARGGLVCGLNAPYSAADDVTHTLRLQATPYGLANAMLEIRNDLIASPAAEEAMAERLAPALSAAIAALTATAKAG